MKIKSSKSFDYLQTTGKVNVKEPKVKGVEGNIAQATPHYLALSKAKEKSSIFF